MNISTNNCLEQIRTRRKTFFLWIPICIIGQIIVVIFFQNVVGVTPKWLDFVLNILANGILFLLLIRVVSVRCPKCGKSIFKYGRFPISLKNIRCQHCDYLIK